MSNSLFSLPIEQQLSPSLTLRKKNGLTLAVINHPKAKGAVTLQGHSLSLGSLRAKALSFGSAKPATLNRVLLYAAASLSAGRGSVKRARPLTALLAMGCGSSQPMMKAMTAFG